MMFTFSDNRGARLEGPAPIDSVAMRRKRAGRIQEEQAAVRERVEHYRPPYIKAVGENEKSRYIQQSRGTKKGANHRLCME